MQEMPIKKEIDRIGQEQMDSYSARNLIEFAVNQLPVDVESVLSVGCGRGCELELMQNKFKRVIGIDYNESSVKIAKEKFDVYQMDMHELKFEDNSFDCVFFRDVFEHSVAPIVAFKEAARVSKKYIFIVLPDETWEDSDLHPYILNLRQMLFLGIKNNYSLQNFIELNVIVNSSIFKERYFLFRKNV